MPRTSVRTSSKQASVRVAAKPRDASSGTQSRSAKRGETETRREEMISVAAYFRAEHHGFDGSDPVGDWLAAEAEIDAMLQGSQQLNLH